MRGQEPSHRPETPSNEQPCAGLHGDRAGLERSAEPSRAGHAPAVAYVTQLGGRRQAGFRPGAEGRGGGGPEACRGSSLSTRRLGWTPVSWPFSRGLIPSPPGTRCTLVEGDGKGAAEFSKEQDRSGGTRPDSPEPGVRAMGSGEPSRPGRERQGQTEAEPSPPPPPPPGSSQPESAFN